MTETVLVVGGSGYLGRSVVDRLDSGETAEPAGSAEMVQEYRVIGTHCSTPAPTTDVRFDFWTDDVGPILEEYDVDVVVYAAANEYGGDVDTGDTDAGGDFADCAERFAAQCAGRRVVYVSSAAVFDGTERRYVESDTRTPPDEYGERLVAFEDAFADHCDDLAVMRTSYLFGFSLGTLDHRLARTRERLRDGESVAYFTDMYKSPVLVTEAAETVTALVGSEATGPVHVPTPRMSVYEFHCEAMRAFGYDPGPIERDSIPVDMDVAPDTSLDSERFDPVVGFEPSSVRGGLESQLDAGAAER